MEPRVWVRLPDLGCWRDRTFPEPFTFVLWSVKVKP